MVLCMVHSYQLLCGHCIFLPAKILLERIYKLEFTALISRFQILEFTARFKILWSGQLAVSERNWSSSIGYQWAKCCPLTGQVGGAVCYIDPDVLCTSTRERRFHTMLADHCVHTRTRTHTHTSTPTHTHTQTHIYNCSLFYNPGGQMHMPSAQFPLTHPGTQSLTVGGEDMGQV